MKTVSQEFQIEECCLAVPCSGRALFFRQKTMRKLRRRRADISHSFRIEYRWGLRHHWPPGKQPGGVHVPHTKHTSRYSHILYVCRKDPCLWPAQNVPRFGMSWNLFRPRRSGLRNHRGEQHRAPQLYPGNARPAIQAPCHGNHIAALTLLRACMRFFQ